MPSPADAGEGDTTAMQNLFPIIRRKRRPLVVTETRESKSDEPNRTEATEGTEGTAPEKQASDEQTPTNKAQDESD